MSFGSPIDKSKVLPLVKDTKWSDMLELNRMAFSDVLPKNSESRALGVAFRLIKKHYPNIEWILSFSDGTQCGDGAIYRASGFYLTSIKKNTELYKINDKVYHTLTLCSARPSIALVWNACQKLNALRNALAHKLEHPEAQKRLVSFIAIFNDPATEWKPTGEQATDVKRAILFLLGALQEIDKPIQLKGHDTNV